MIISPFLMAKLNLHFWWLNVNFWLLSLHFEWSQFNFWWEHVHFWWEQTLVNLWKSPQRSSKDCRKTWQVSRRRQVAAQKGVVLYQMVTQQDLSSRKQAFCRREGDSQTSNSEVEVDSMIWWWIPHGRIQSSKLGIAWQHVSNQMAPYFSHQTEGFVQKPNSILTYPHYRIIHILSDTWIMAETIWKTIVWIISIHTYPNYIKPLCFVFVRKNAMNRDRNFSDLLFFSAAFSTIVSLPAGTVSRAKSAAKS